jgi:hypothetical protein
MNTVRVVMMLLPPEGLPAPQSLRISGIRVKLIGRRVLPFRLFSARSGRVVAKGRSREQRRELVRWLRHRGSCAPATPSKRPVRCSPMPWRRWTGRGAPRGSRSRGVGLENPILPESRPLIETEAESAYQLLPDTGLIFHRTPAASREAILSFVEESLAVI